MANKSSVNSALYTSELKGHAAGKAEGLAEGMEKGRAEGMEKGLAEGEKRKAVEIARAMKAEGIDPNTIAKITKLTDTEIRRI
jgi:predicted transposase/invertase (TIGR01784 family)